MDATEILSGVTDTNKYKASALKCLLADEFIVMNKISCCLLETSTPFIISEVSFFQGLYDELKINSEKISAAVKHNNSAAISITDIVTNTSLKKGITLNSRVGVIETLISDNISIISRLNEIITDLTLYRETECCAIFDEIRKSHSKIAGKLTVFLKYIISGKRIQTYKEPG